MKADGSTHPECGGEGEPLALHSDPFCSIRDVAFQIDPSSNTAEDFVIWEIESFSCGGANVESNEVDKVLSMATQTCQFAIRPNDCYISMHSSSNEE